MDLGADADGELLQRALDGEQVSEPGILELVAVLHAVQAVDQAGLAPRREFVSDLRARLLADEPASGTPAAPVAAPDTDRTDRTDDTDGPRATVSVLHVAARPLKLVAAVAAGIIVVAGALGAASRSAVPGDVLYGVKQLLDRAAVQLAGSRYDEGLTHLAQAQEHIGDARDLLDQGSPATHDLDTAYDSATDAARRAQTILVEVYRTEGRAEALTELADFYARAIPQVDAMRTRVPAGSLPAWQRLRDTLASGDVATLRELATCGACGARAAQARAALAALPGAGGIGVGGSPVNGTAPPGATAGTGAPGAVGTPVRPPGPTATGPGGLPLPGGSVTNAAPLPGSTVKLPTVGVNTSSVGVGGGGVTLPGATLPLPSVGVTSSTVRVVVPLPTLGTGLPGLPPLSASLPLSPLPTVPKLP